MLKQSPSRNQRSKGFKVKHVLQVCLLLAICVWLLNQVKHSYDKRKAYEESSAKLSEKVNRELETMKLGRKNLHPRVEETALESDRHGERGELEEEVEESKPEEEEDDEGRGVGDDEIDGHDQEKAEEEESEEVEDLIDEEDKEMEDGSEEQESEGKENLTENLSLLGGGRNSREAREEHYKGDDASSAVGQNTQTLSTEFEIGGLRKVKEEDIKNAGNIELDMENKDKGTEEIIIINSLSPKVGISVTTEYGALGNALHGEEKGDVINLANSVVGSISNSSTEVVTNENPEVNNNSRLILVETPNSLNGIGIVSGSTHHLDRLDVTSNGSQTFLQAVLGWQSGSSNRTVENEQSNFTVPANLDTAKEDSAVFSGPEFVVPEQIVKFDAPAQTKGSSASKTINENDGTVDSGDSSVNGGAENTEEISALLTTNANTDAIKTESFDSSDSSFYQEDRDQAIFETSWEVESMAKSIEDALE